MATLACIRRMQDYLLLDEIQDVSPAEAARASRHSEAVEKAGFVEISQRRLRAPLPTTEQHVVRFFNASIAPGRGKSPVLSGVNINILRESLTIVTGRTGGGKTTLLRAIIGGAEIVQGSMHVDPRIGYCGQQPWIRNDTVCKNIISEYMFDPAWYDAVIKACLLEEDLRNLPDGDKFRAGSGGVNLSGGQKQRVAIARAVYSRSPILVFDDALAALDRPTAAGVFCGLFGNRGLLKKTNATVIMAMGKTADYLDLATDVLYIRSDGTVSIHQNSNQPKLSDAALFKLLARVDSDDEEAPKDSKPEARTNSATNVASISAVQEEKDALRLHGSKGLYRFYLRSVGWVRFSVFLILAVLFVFAERLPRIFIRIWIDIDPDNMRLFIPFSLAGVASGAISGLNLFYYWFFFVPESAESLHRMLADVVMRATLPFLTATDSGSILNRFSQDMNLLTQELPISFWKAAYFFLLLVLDVCVLVSGVSYAWASLPFLIGILYIVQTYYLRTSRQLRYMDLEAKAPLYTHFTETSAGLEHIRCFGWQAKVIKKTLELLEYSQKPFYHMYAIQRWLTLVMDLISLALATVVVTLVLRIQGVTTPAGFGLTFLNIISLGSGMTSFIEKWTEMETSLGAIARLRTFLKGTPVEKAKDDCDPVPENWPTEGHIVMSHVTARYRETDERPALHNVSVNFRPGKKAAIIGRSGSGKSTMIATILNCLDYTGSIQIDGRELSTVAPDTLRSRVTTVTQDGIKLDTSVRDNLIPEEMHLPTEERTENSVIFQALGKVGLSDHFTGKLDMLMTEVGLSGGQHQQFSVARAIIHHKRTRSKIVLLDEPTSSMGFTEDCAMQGVMATEFASCTVVTVTHRLETVENRQIVVELENGSVAGYVD